MITADDHKRIANAIHSAEGRTSAELVCVVKRASSDYATMPIVWSALAALALPWLLVALTQWSVGRILLAQLGLFAGLLLVLSIPAIRVLLVPRPMQRSHAHRAAMEQFMIRGLARKRERTGVLIFVSLAERYVRIVADEGVSSIVQQAEWQKAVDSLIAHMRAGRVAEGFIAAIDHCAAVLEKALPDDPAAGDVLPDRIYVID
jgi:putative membrane protein